MTLFMFEEKSWRRKVIMLCLLLLLLICEVHFLVNRKSIFFLGCLGFWAEKAFTHCRGDLEWSWEIMQCCFCKAPTFTSIVSNCTVESGLGCKEETISKALRAEKPFNSFLLSHVSWSTEMSHGRWTRDHLIFLFFYFFYKREVRPANSNGPEERQRTWNLFPVFTHS